MFYPGVVWEKETQSPVARGQKEKDHEKGGAEDGCSCKRKSLGRKISWAETDWRGEEESGRSLMIYHFLYL